MPIDAAAGFLSQGLSAVISLGVFYHVSPHQRVRAAGGLPSLSK